MKKCKSCQKEIDTKAKKCPFCQTDQRNWFARHLILTGILALFIIIIVFSNAGSGNNNGKKVGDNNSSTTNKVDNKQPEQQTTYKVGDVIKTDKFELIINSVEERAVVGAQYFEKKPSQGGTFVAVQYQYKNSTDKPISTFSKPTIRLVDKNGTKYNTDAGASVNFATELKLDMKILSDLNPGITVNDADIFEISKEQYASQGWSLLIKADKDIKVLIK